MGYCDCKKTVEQNLRDAGCAEETITVFWESLKNGNKAKALKLLGKHRNFLLDTIHNEQKQIDCLDYLVYQMNKQNKGIKT